MANETQIIKINRVGVIGFLIALIAIGGTIILTPDQLDAAYVCDNGDQPPTWGIFYGGISGTGLTAYPFKENRTQPTRCTGGVWTPLKVYAKENNIDPLKFLEEPTTLIESESNGVRWICPPNGAPCIKDED